MYSLMVKLFPLIHGVFAMIVSSRRSHVGPGGEAITFDAPNRDDDYSDDDEGYVDDGLTKRQRSVVEFFIAKLRLRSQKTMRYWALVPPLAGHSRGHTHNPPNHPLHGAGCGMRTMWGHLDSIYDSGAAARADIVNNQQTISIAMDNWLHNRPKMWQKNGSSSNFLRGTAAFMKKDRAIRLPAGSIICSPSGDRFEVQSSAYLDASFV